MSRARRQIEVLDGGCSTSAGRPEEMRWKMICCRLVDSSIWHAHTQSRSTVATPKHHHYHDRHKRTQGLSRCSSFVYQALAFQCSCLVLLFRLHDCFLFEQKQTLFLTVTQ